MWLYVDSHLPGKIKANWLGQKKKRKKITVSKISKFRCPSRDYHDAYGNLTILLVLLLLILLMLLILMHKVGGTRDSHVWNVIYIPICILISPSLLEKKKDCKRFKSDLIRR
jgi:hypothetical protein